MNPLFVKAGETLQMGWLMGLMTALFLVSFLAWVWWAYTPRHKEMMDKAAQMPFDDGGEL